MVNLQSNIDKPQIKRYDVLYKKRQLKSNKVNYQNYLNLEKNYVLSLTEVENINFLTLMTQAKAQVS